MGKSRYEIVNNIKRTHTLKNVIICYDIIPLKKDRNDIHIFIYENADFMVKKIISALDKYGGVKFQIGLNVQFQKFNMNTLEHFRTRPWFQSPCIQYS